MEPHTNKLIELAKPIAKLITEDKTIDRSSEAFQKLLDHSGSFEQALAAIKTARLLLLQEGDSEE